MIGVMTSIKSFIFGKIVLINLILFWFSYNMIFNRLGINGRFQYKKFYFYALIIALILDVIWILV